MDRSALEQIREEDALLEFILSEIAEAENKWLSDETANMNDRQILHRLLAIAKQQEQTNENRHKAIMSALSDLTDALGGLATDLQTDTAAVVSAVSHIGSPAATDAQLVPLTAAVTAARATVAANTKALNDAVAGVVTPPLPPQPPTPAA
jgi:esterase/lipase